MTIIERLEQAAEKLDEALKEADEWIETMDKHETEGNITYLYGK